ncbi:hypothetical protein SOVF_097440 [Spinacia oleracea]|nr:hypothetical protein SOVF_097440 [Spinacia oleracea]
MPLVRFAIKNEYGLGVGELYKDGVESEDPKAVLDGVAVAGLVGLLRQLGDLAQFAAEVFHGLQEQVASTSSRSRKLVNRVQRVEASLPSLEKAILSQTDHLRFAYTPGSERHAYIRTERNLFICDDFPHYIMDSYEECREPPHLQLLDRFDSGGPGSCLKRYSDPTFFKRASSCSQVSNSETCQRERKTRKTKKRRSWQQSGQLPKSTPNLNGSSRMQFSSTGHGQSSLSHTGSTFDMTFKSDMGDQSDSHGSKDGVDFMECVSRPSISTRPDETKNKGLSTSLIEAEVNNNGSIHPDEQISVASDDKPCSNDAETIVPHSSNATWDELLEIVEPTDVTYKIEDTRQMPATNCSPHELELKLVNKICVNQVNDLPEQGSNPKLKADAWHLRTTCDENFMEPIGLSCRMNEVQDLLKINFDLQEHYLEPPHLESCTQVVDSSEVHKSPKPNTNDNDPVYRRLETGAAPYFLEANFDVAEKELETVYSEHVSAVDAFTEGGSNVEAIEWNVQDPETVNAELVSQVDAFPVRVNHLNVIEWSERDLQTVNPEHDRVNAFSECGNNVKVIEWKRPESDTITTEHVSEMDTCSESVNSVKLIKWNQQELFDDIDSGTENFVDALNTIESESESDFETEMIKEVPSTGSKEEEEEYAANGQTSEVTSHLEPDHQHLATAEMGENAVNGQTSKITSHIEPKHQLLATDKIGENAVNDQTSEITSPLEPEHQCLTTSYNVQEEDSDDLERSATSMSSANTWSPDRTWSSHDKSESATGQKRDVPTCLSEEQSLQTIQSATLSNVPQGLDFCVDDPAGIVDPAICEITKFGSDAASDERITCAPHMPQEVSAGSSTSDPLAFWTNGTLFGLAPSKPIVFSMPDSVDSAPTSNGGKVGQCGLDAVQKVDPEGTRAASVNESEHGSSKHLSHQRFEKTCDTSVGHDKINFSDHPVTLDLSNGDAMPLGSKVPRGTNMKNVSSEATGASEDRSSLLSVLSRGLLKNGLRRSGSLGYFETHENSVPLKADERINRCQDDVSHAVPETNLKEKLTSPVNSPPPSPPLGHMKISFQPVDSFDTSRLKLKYPEGIDQYENTLDAFPTFQLVPESIMLQHDIGSDSDDDTFSRSYACMSDESHSHMSDSNSDQWESGDSAESNDHTVYDGLHRISSAESASVSPQLEEADHGSIHVGSGSFSDAHSLSNPLVGLPTLNAKSPFGCQKVEPCVSPALHSSHLQEPTHEPPPLPPMQWRVSRLFDEVMLKQNQVSDSLSQSFVPRLLNSAIAQPAKVDLAKLVSTAHESATIVEPKKVEDQKFVQEQTYHAEKEKETDDKGDFLHQIRTKSFNLKRTGPTRSTYTPTPATSNKITAILQKASAIRKVVGSDEGEDDSWSDT